MRHVGLSILLAMALVDCASGKASGDDGNCSAGEILSNGGCVTLCSDDGACSGQRYCNDGMCIEGVRPEISAHSPVSDATDVAADASIFLTFSAAMDPATTGAAFSITGPQGPVSGSLVWNDAYVIMTFTPATPMRPGGSYRVQVNQSALSSAGVPLATTFSFSFVVYLPPVAVVGMTPVPGSVDVGVVPNISVTFSVPMDAVSMTQTFHLLANGVTEVFGNAALDTAGMLLTFTPGGTLAFNTTYQLRVDDGAKSVAGATLAAPWERSFTTTATPDLSLPDVVTTAVSVIVAGPQLDGLSSYTFAGTASDADTPIEQVQVQIVPAGSPVGVDWVVATIVPSGNTATWSYRWFPKMLDPLPTGTYTLQARAYDKGGNLKLATPMSFEVDVRPPAVPTFASPAPTTWESSTLTLSVSGENNSSAEVLVDNVAATGSPFSLGPSGTSMISLKLSGPTGPKVIAVFAIDQNGNRNNTALAAVVNLTAYFADDFENGTAKWTFTGDWGPTSTNPHGGANSLTDSPSGNYDPYGGPSTATMALPFSLQGATTARLTFWQRYDGGSSDNRNVYIQDGGTSWTQIDSSSGGSATTWTQVAIPLTTRIGHTTLKVRFEFDPGCCTAHDGWYIDDVRVEP